MAEKVLELEYLDKETRRNIIVPSNFRRYTYNDVWMSNKQLVIHNLIR